MTRPITLSLLALCLALQAFFSHGADYAREKKWADEILPGIVVGDPLWLKAGGHKFLGLYAPAPRPDPARPAVILVHGIGVHPDWGLIGGLRSALADAGHPTLSIQMPVREVQAKAQDYAPDMAEAAARIAAAVAALQAKGHGAQAIVAHSLGARMANEYFARQPGAAVKSYAAIGLCGPWPGAMPQQLKVLDLYGSADLPQVRETAPQRRSAAARQQEVAGADHFFAGKEPELAEALAAFLKTAPAP